MFDFDVITGPGPTKPTQRQTAPASVAAPVPAERQPPPNGFAMATALADHGADGQSFLSGDRNAKLPG
jgi:hypothetical protein